MPLDLFLRDAALLSGQPDQHGWRECTMQIGKLGGGVGGCKSSSNLSIWNRNNLVGPKRSSIDIRNK